MLSRLKLLGIALFSAVETAALAVWLLLQRGAHYNPVAAAVLAVGLTVEHFISYNVRNNRPLLQVRDLPFKQIVVVSILETIVWVAWLLAFPYSPLLATIILAVLLIPVHSIEGNVNHGRSFLYRLLDPKTIVFSIVESVTGGAWLLLAGTQPVLAIVVLFVGMTLEHIISVSQE